MVIGEVEEASAYINKAGEPAASLEVTARMIKFLGGDHGDEGDDGTAFQADAAPQVNGKKTPAKRQLAGADIPF